MKNDKCLSDYQVPNEATLMKIFVKPVKEDPFELKVSSNETIGDIKNKIEQEKGIKPQQRLLFDATQLDSDDKTIEDCNISDKGTLDLAPMKIYVKVPKTGKLESKHDQQVLKH